MIKQLIANFGQAGLPLVLWAAGIGVLVTIILTAVRWREGPPLGDALSRSAGEVGTVVSAFAILIVGLWSYPISTPRQLALVPLITIFQPWPGAPWWAEAEFAIGNTFLFLPFGLFLQLRFRDLSLGRIAGGVAVASIVIEAWQWVFGTGRVSSVDDVIFNTLGAVLGALVVRGLRRLYAGLHTSSLPAGER